MSDTKQLTKAQQHKKLIVGAVILVICVVAYIAVGVLPGIFNDANVRHIKEMANSLAEQQARSIDAQVARIQGDLQAALVLPDSGVNAALQQGTPDVLQSAVDKLRATNPEILQAQLIPAGANYAAAGLRFSQIDRLRKADQGAPLYPEAFRENDRFLFDVILPVKNENGKALGYLIAVFNVQVFKNSLLQVAPEQAQTIFYQKFDQQNAMKVFSLGENGESRGMGDNIKTSTPHWNVQIVLGTQLLKDAIVSPMLLFSAQALAIISSLLALMFVHKRTRIHSAKAEEEHVTPIQIKAARKIDKASLSGDSLELDELEKQDNQEQADPLFQNTDVLDLDEGEDFLDFRRTSVKDDAPTKILKQEVFDISASIFRDYDIRGNAEAEISDEVAHRIGRAFGSECREHGQQNVLLAGDGRLSTPRLKAAVQQGLLESGCNVIDLGNVPTPLMYFAANTVQHATSGIMVTASHNPAADNGFKMVIDNHTLASEEIQKLLARVKASDFAEGQGEVSQLDIVPAYVSHVANDIVLAGSYKVVLDCGNGIAGNVAPRLLEELGCDVVRLYCDIDGSFPNHAPDPSVMENLSDLVAKVQSENADLGIALDGDGDRLTVVTATGKIILPDLLLMLFAKDIVSRNPGSDVVFDVKCTRRLNALISSYGGRPVMWKSGHSHIKNKMIESGALLGGELSGHIFFKERWYGFDDGMYASARLLEIMSIRDQDLDGIFAAFPDSASTPEIRIAVPEEKKFSIIERLVEKGEWGNGKCTTLDGIRVDFAKGWGLVRASNTSAALTLRFEADDQETLATVQHVFRQQLMQVDKGLRLPF